MFDEFNLGFVPILQEDIVSIPRSGDLRSQEGPVPLKELEATREKLVKGITGQITDDEKKFLLTFKSMKPEWKLLGMPEFEQIANLPSVRWKLMNLKAMPEKKHKEAYEKLKSVLLGS